MNIKIKQQLPLLVMSIALFLGSCAKSQQGVELPKDFEVRSFEVTNFDQINLTGYFEINLIKGDGHSLKISGAGDDLDLLKVENKSNALNISYTEVTSPSYPMLLEMTSASFKQLQVSGALGGTSIIDGYTEDYIALRIDGGSGRLELNNCIYKDIDIALNGAGRVNLLESQGDNGKAAVNGAGLISIKVANHLEAIVNGVGSIQYDGDPEVVKKIGGLGTVSHI